MANLSTSLKKSRAETPFLLPMRAREIYFRVQLKANSSFYRGAFIFEDILKCFEFPGVGFVQSPATNLAAGLC